MEFHCRDSCSLALSSSSAFSLSMIPECPGMHARTQLEENPVLPQVLTQTILKKKEKK